MRNTDLYIATKVCWEHDVFVVVKPFGNNKYKIAISRNGREKIGEQIYSDVPKSKVLIYEKGGKKYRQDITIPSVHQKIEELYLHLYITNFKGIQPAAIVSELDYELPPANFLTA